MSLYLNHEDLSNFLRSRRGADCRIAADWVSDNQQHPAVEAAVNMLEQRLIELSRLEVFQRGGIPNLPRLALMECLALVAPRYSTERLAQPIHHAWLLRTAHSLFRRRGASWGRGVLSALEEASQRPPSAGPVPGKGVGERFYRVDFILRVSCSVHEVNPARAMDAALGCLENTVPGKVSKVRITDMRTGEVRAPDNEVTDDEGFYPFRR